METQNINSEVQKFLLENSRIPRIHKDTTYDLLVEVNPKLIDLCKYYSQEFPAFVNMKKRGLFLYSPTPGNAKSSLSVCILKEIIKMGKVRRKSTFLSFSELLSFMRKKYIYHEEFDINDDLEDLISRSEIVILDDVGKQIADKYAADYFFSIVNSLYENMKAVVMTSNFSLSGLKERFETQGEIINSIFSRIEALCTIAKLQNVDYRNKQCTK